MILKVIKTYEKQKNCLCVAIVDDAIIAIESTPAFLSIKQAVEVGQLITSPVDLIQVTNTTKPDEEGVVQTYTYWKLKA